MVIDALRERRPPFSPDDVAAEFAALLKSLSHHNISGDRYAGEWPRERFRAQDIGYEPAEKPKSDLYRDLLPTLNARRIDLIDDKRLQAAAGGLGAQDGEIGKDSIDHAPNGHDDLANAVAGVAGLLAVGSYMNDLNWVGVPESFASTYRLSVSRIELRGLPWLR